MRARALLGGGFACAASHVHAQAYPSRVIRMVIPCPPGGGSIDDYAKIVRAEIAKWDGVIRKAGIRIE